jgi:hypothetical protein
MHLLLVLVLVELVRVLLLLVLGSLLRLLYVSLVLLRLRSLLGLLRRGGGNGSCGFRAALCRSLAAGASTGGGGCGCGCCGGCLHCFLGSNVRLVGRALPREAVLLVVFGGLHGCGQGGGELLLFSLLH